MREIAMGPSRIVEGGNQFACALYQQLRAQSGNLFFSPSSISLALAMTYAGAAGRTAREMAETLHFPAATDEFHEGMRTLQSAWSTSDPDCGIQLRLANRLWGQQRYEFLSSFLQLTRDVYGAEIARLDFVQGEQARATINDWIAAQTQQKIRDLIPPDLLDAATRLVLTNAVYFYGIWAEPFPPGATQDAVFHLSSRQKTKVPLMHVFADFRYAEFDDLQILELPYGDGSLSMLVLLPRQPDELPELEAKLTWQNLQRWSVGGQHLREVEVYLPRFRTSSQLDLGETLTGMGMPQAFDLVAADFSAMTGDRDLFISSVIHQAFVDVNEEGTEAAAATAVVMSVRGVPAPKPPPPVFRADHPFVFCIRDNRNDALLFLGRITDPLK